PIARPMDFPARSHRGFRWALDGPPIPLRSRSGPGSDQDPIETPPGSPSGVASEAPAAPAGRGAKRGRDAALDARAASRSRCALVTLDARPRTHQREPPDRGRSCDMGYQIPNAFLIRALARSESPRCEGCGSRMFVPTRTGKCPYCYAGYPPRVAHHDAGAPAHLPFAPRLGERVVV